MDLSRPIIYNGITLSPPSASPTSPRSGYEVNDVNFSEIEVDSYLDPRAVQDGADAVDVFLRTRSIVISAAVLGTSKGQLFDNLQSLLSAFNPVIAYNSASASQGFLPLKFDQPTIDTATWTSGYIPMQINARPLIPPRYSVRRLETTDSGRGLAVPVVISLISKYPVKESQSSSTVYVSASSQTVTYTYNGDYPAWPIVTFGLSANGNSAATIRFTSTTATGNCTIYLNLASAYAGVPTSYVIDTYSRTITLTDSSGESIAQGILRTDLDSVFRPVDGGSFSISSGGTSSMTQSRFAITYREAWV